MVRKKEKCSVEDITRIYELFQKIIIIFVSNYNLSVEITPFLEKFRS